MTKKEQVKKQLEDAGFLVTEWKDRLYVREETKNPAVCTFYGYVQVWDNGAVSTANCASPKARAVARTRAAFLPGDWSVPPSTPIEDLKHGVEKMAENTAKVYYAGVRAAQVGPVTNPAQKAQGLTEEQRRQQISEITRNIRTYPAAYGCQVDDLVALVTKDVAQRYEKIIEQRVRDSVEQLRAKLQKEAEEKAKTRFVLERKEARDKLHDLIATARDDIDSLSRAFEEALEDLTR